MERLDQNLIEDVARHLKEYGVQPQEAIVAFAEALGYESDVNGDGQVLVYTSYWESYP